MKKNNYFMHAMELIRGSYQMSPANYFTLIGSSFVISAKAIMVMILPALLIEVITNSGAFDKVLIAIFIYAFIILLADASEKAFSLLSTAFGYKANNRANLSVGQKGMRIDYKGWENSETYEHIAKANNATWFFQSVADMVCENWVVAIITMIPVTYILAQVNILVIILLVLSVIIELLLERHADKKVYEWDRKKAKDEKKLNYNEKVMTDLKYGKELRLYQAMQGVIDKYEESKKRAFHFQKNKKKAETTHQLSSSIITCIQSIIIFYFAIKQYEQGAIAISAFLLFIGAIRQFTESAKTMIETTVWVHELTDYYRIIKHLSMNLKIC